MMFKMHCSCITHAISGCQNDMVSKVCDSCIDYKYAREAEAVKHCAKICRHCKNNMNTLNVLSLI